MNIIVESILVIVISVLAFLLLRSTIPLLLRALLSGPFNMIYLNYVQSGTKLKIDEAFASLNSDRAWSEMVYAKVYEIGSNRVPYAKREQNLRYIKQASLHSKKLVDELIKVLPKQYRNPEFQANLACYICELANTVKLGNGNTKPVATVNKIIIDTLSFAFSIWIAGCSYLLLGMEYVFGQYPPLLMTAIALAFLIAMNIPTLRLVRHGLADFSLFGYVAALTLTLFGVFASIRIDRIHNPEALHLDPYGNPGAVMSIEYPTWITLDNSGCKGAKFSVFHSGGLTAPIRFRLSDNRFSFINKDCNEIIPEIEPSQPENQAYEFYVSVQDKSAFFSGMDRVAVVPQYTNSTTKVDFAKQDYEYLRLENWFWNATRNWTYSYITAGSATLWLIAGLLFKSRRP